MLSQKTISETLHTAIPKDAQQDVVVSGIVLRGGHVGFTLELSPEKRGLADPLRQQCEARLRRLPGVDKVTILLATERSTAPEPARKAEWISDSIPHVRHIIAVASGKGGVGKSTVTANLAVALAAEGLRVGVLDADIYGPSQPILFGIQQRPEVVDGQIIPLTAHGIQLMSIGFLVDEGQAVVWRGSMVTKALRQMLRGVRWGTADAPLDLLLVDMPPGTGDVHLSLVQGVPLSGAVVVSTPQAVAVADAVKCVAMFQQCAVPLLGMVENMCGFKDPASGQIHDIFGRGGAQKAATDHQITFLGEIPLDPTLRQSADHGTPAGGQAFTAIAKQLLPVL